MAEPFVIQEIWKFWGIDIELLAFASDTTVETFRKWSSSPTLNALTHHCLV